VGKEKILYIYIQWEKKTDNLVN